MKVTHVAIRPTRQSTDAGCPALTPELLAATGARYSRNNEGLRSILDRIDLDNPDKSVDSIFRMVDYGHQSIADMAPVAMFIDGITIWLAYFVWSICPIAGGQESSTRYIDLAPSALPSPDELGIPASLQDGWRTCMARSLHAYRESLGLWKSRAAQRPDLMHIPATLLADSTEQGRKRIARMRQNFVFDRARYFLPMATATNLALVMSARSWVHLCQHLCSHPLPEANRLGDTIRGQLALSAPRLIKHAVRTESTVLGLAKEFDTWSRMADGIPPCLQHDAPCSDNPACAFLDVLAPPRMDGSDFARDLALHDNRYAWFGDGLRRTAVRFGWESVAMAEIRDLNRHRTGTKHCPMVPNGFYGASDEMPADAEDALVVNRTLAAAGAQATARARGLLADGVPSYVYWALLGTQFPFEHLTTADKFIYEAELRTGTGAHYRYAQHLRDVLELWYERYPETRGLILEGSAEPE